MAASSVEVQLEEVFFLPWNVEVDIQVPTNLVKRQIDI